MRGLIAAAGLLGLCALAACGGSAHDGAGGGAAAGSATGGAGGGSGGGGNGIGGATAGAGGAAGAAGQGGGAAADPAVFRTPDPLAVCSPTPAEPCTVADMGFVASEYGSELVRVDDGGGVAYRLTAFVEREGPANIDVLVVDELAAPLVGVPVAFYWSGAPDPSRPDEWYPNKITTPTEVDGTAGFALGGGAYLPCCGCGGPHAIWVSEPGPQPDTSVPSDLADRLGMLGGTNHRHLDLVFQRVAPPPAAPPAAAAICPLP